MLLILALSMLPICYVAAQPQSVKSNEVVVIDGGSYYIHNVIRGETLSSISRAYGISIADIEKDNPVLKDGLKAGQTIRVRCDTVPEVRMSRRQYNRTFDEHTVLRGETTYSIARRYLLSIQTLIEDNPGLDPARINVGQKLRIRKSDTGETSPDEIKQEIGEISLTLNRLSEDYYYHVVEVGETLYSLSRKLNVSEDVIRSGNDLSEGLRAGTLLKIPVEGHEELKMQLVEVPVYYPDDTSRQYSYEGVLDITMMLPLWDNGIRTNFVEFYQGALLALEDFKASGYSIDFNLYDTERQRTKVENIVNSRQLDNTDLIIGPVYETEMAPVMKLAQSRGIPVVSPLSTLEGRYGDFVYQLPPDQESRYDKMKELFSGDKNIVFFTTDDNDDEFERDMVQLAGPAYYQRVRYSKELPAEYIDSMLVSNSRPNLYVVTAGNAMEVDQILASISSIQNNRLARSIRTGPIQVIGNSRWMRYSIIDRNLFFKLNVTFVTSYHSDRSDEMVNNFDKRYMAAFGDIPSLYSYRGYDAVRMFAEAMLTGDKGRGFTDNLNAAGRPLQTKYVFRRGPQGFYVNDNWSLVTYRSNYTIQVR